MVKGGQRGDLPPSEVLILILHRGKTSRPLLVQTELVQLHWGGISGSRVNIGGIDGDDKRGRARSPI